MTSTERTNELRRVAVSVCDGCLSGWPGQCKMPDCIFIRRHISEVPDLWFEFEVLDGAGSSARTLPDSLLDDGTISTGVTSR